MTPSHESLRHQPALALAAGFGAALLFWVTDSALDSHFLGFRSLGESLLPLHDGPELGMRLLIVVLMISIGVYAHTTLARQRAHEERLHAEIRQREQTAARLTRGERAIHELYRLTTVSNLSFHASVHELLCLGRRRFGMEIGILSHVTGERYEVVEAVAPDGAIVSGDVYPLGKTYCVLTLQSPEPVFIEHAAESAVRNHPAYLELQLESYIGTRIEVKGAVFGTVNFSDRQPARERFTPADLDFLQLMGKWIGRELERLEAERILRQDAEVFNTTVESIVITDAEFRVVRVNPAFTAVTGYVAEEMLDHPLPFFAAPTGEEGARHIVPQLMGSADRWHGEYTVQRRDGRQLPVWMSIKQLATQRGSDVGYVFLFSDISQIKQYQDRLSHMAHHDGLTGLPNRLSFTLCIDHAIERAKRSQGHVALLFVDLDDFKAVNDNLGHAAGDELLQAASQRLLASVRAEDTVSRIGGDEFTVVLDSIHGRDDAVHVVEKILAALSRPFLLDGQEAHIGASVGVSLYPDDAGDSAGMLQAADAAMYLAKQAGKNAYRFLPLPVA